MKVFIVIMKIMKYFIEKNEFCHEIFLLTNTFIGTIICFISPFPEEWRGSLLASALAQNSAGAGSIPTRQSFNFVAFHDTMKHFIESMNTQSWGRLRELVHGEFIDSMNTQSWGRLRELIHGEFIEFSMNWTQSVV